MSPLLVHMNYLSWNKPEYAIEIEYHDYSIDDLDDNIYKR